MLNFFSGKGKARRKERLHIFAGKMKITEFFSGKGKDCKEIKEKTAGAEIFAREDSILKENI